MFRYKAPAKVNLSLAILRRDDKTGLHFLDTVIAKIDLYDEIEIAPARRAGMVLRVFPEQGAFTQNGMDMAQNTVLKAYDALNRELDYLLPGMEVRVTKRIPSGTGLGGAASDAAGFLKLVYHIAVNAGEFGSRVRDKLREMDIKKMAKIGFQVGADVPAFLYDGTVRVRGFGEAVERIKLSQLEEFKVVIAVPAARLSTKEMYAQVEVAERKNHTVDFLCKWYAEGAESALAIARNDFEEIASRQCPEVREAIEALKSLGYQCVMLTGSGSAVIALAKKSEKLPLPMLSSGAHCYTQDFLV